MKTVHGELHPRFEKARWSIVELDTEQELSNLVYLAIPRTHEQGLLKGTDRNYRLLKNVVKNAKESNYFDNEQLHTQNPDEYKAHQRYLERFRRNWSSLRGDNRIVLRSLVKSERESNPDGTYYIQDGDTRMLAYLYQIIYEGKSFLPVEAFLAEGI